jgi:hypothetical protein
MRHVVWVMGLAAVLGGCKTAERAPSAICDRYLSCLSAASPATFPAALATYGPDGPCWKSESTAASCETACREGLKPLELAYPTRPECAIPTEAGVPDARVTDANPTVDFGPLPVASEVDVLFMIDNSNAMEWAQQRLNGELGVLLEALRNPKLGGAGCSSTNRAACKLPSLHIGVVSSDLGAGSYSLPTCEVKGGDGGKLQSKARRSGCTPPKDPYISYVDGVTNVPSATSDPVDQVKEAFSCIASLGTGGCGFEQQLESVRLALDPTKNLNPGFLRSNAYLAVVLLTDEDDCSAAKPTLYDPSQQGLTDPLGPLTSFRCFEFGLQCDQKGRGAGPRTSCVPAYDWLTRVDKYTTFFRGLKKAGRFFMLAIAGPTEPVVVGVDGSSPILKTSCTSAAGVGAPAIRIASVVKSFGTERGFFNTGLESGGVPVGVNICSNDLGPALRLLGERITAAGL